MKVKTIFALLMSWYATRCPPVRTIRLKFLPLIDNTKPMERTLVTLFWSTARLLDMSFDLDIKSLIHLFYNSMNIVRYTIMRKILLLNIRKVKKNVK